MPVKVNYIYVQFLKEKRIFKIKFRGVVRKLIVGLALISGLLSVNTLAQENNTTASPKYFYKKLEGIIGEKYPIGMELVREDSVLRGYYFYENKNIPIPFTYSSSIDKDGNYIIEEDAGYTESGEQIITGKLIGKFVAGDKFEGKWQNHDGTKTLPLKLSEKYSDDCARVNIISYEKNIGDCESDNCFSVSILYPEVILSDNTIETRINTSIKNSLLEYSVEDKLNHYSSIEELADSFYAWYKADSLISRGDDYKLFFAYDFGFMIDYNDKNILSIRKTLYQYTGGAHGGTMIDYLNFNLQNGKEINLSDIFKDDYKPALDKLGEEPFREFYKLKPNDDFEASGFWFADNKFSVNETFGFNTEGIVFQFNQYEVAPYALGAASITIPYKQLKEIIKENSLLDYIIK